MTEHAPDGDTTTAIPALTEPQRRALRAWTHYRHDAASNHAVWDAGVNHPRRVLNNLVTLGLVTQGEWEDEYEGYLWYLTDAGREALDAIQ